MWVALRKKRKYFWEKIKVFTNMKKNPEKVNTLTNKIMADLTEFQKAFDL